MYSKKLLLVLIICITCLPIFLGAYTGIEGTKLITDTIIDEDFETGTMPSNWTVIDGGGDNYKWNVVATGASFYEPPDCGSYYAFYNDDAAGYGSETVEYLLSPVCYTTNSDSLKLQYGWGYMEYSGESLTSQYRIFKSGTWGTWVIIATYTGTSVSLLKSQ